MRGLNHALSLNDKVTRSWLFFSVGCLLLGGLLSLFLLFSRIPLVNQILNEPHLAKRILVVHVTLTLSCWFFGYLVTLFKFSHSKNSGYTGVKISLFGVVTFACGGLFFSSEPILSNYMPVIHHPIFLIGSCIFLFGVIFSFFDRQILKSPKFKPDFLLDQTSALGIKVASINFLIGIAFLVFTAMTSEHSGKLKDYYEVMFWGPGHIFQMTQMCALLSVWLVLFKKITSRPLININLAYICFSLLLAPTLVSPLLLMEGTSSPIYYSGFELIMRWCTWPSAALVIALIFTELPTLLKTKFRTELNGLFCSVFLLLLGFFLGSLIRDTNTLVPAHYHATIGAVTLAYMCISYLLFDYFKLPAHSQRQKKWTQRQPILFTVGQFLFCAGLAYAGHHGMGRKVYGSEQVVKQTEQYIGLGIMGLGGILAVVGGGLFFYLLFMRLKPILKSN